MKISVASGKGGTGKTTFAVNFSLFLNNKNKNKVVLVDLDVEEPDCHIFLNDNKLNTKECFRQTPKVNEKCNLCGKCADICEFNAIAVTNTKVIIFPELCHSCFACIEMCPQNAFDIENIEMGEIHWENVTNENLCFIEGKLKVGEVMAVPLIKQTKNFASEKFKGATYFIFDSPPGTSCPVIEATKDSDFIVLVTEPTPFGFHDLKIAVETMQKLKKKFGVVINKSGIGNSKESFGQELYNYCKNENIPILGEIPYSREIAELYSRGKDIITIPSINNIFRKIEKGITGLL
ncbi:MAG: ATP-binding protein [Candidatus Cloacimonetes bacterium]|nr:ATP-binding protein [Candidatus Cloacimonadota bacterium]